MRQVLINQLHIINSSTKVSKSQNGRQSWLLIAETKIVPAALSTILKHFVLP